MSEYVYRPEPILENYEEAVQLLAGRVGRAVTPAWIDHTNPAHLAAIEQDLRAEGVEVRQFTVDPDAWRRYVAEAGYRERYPGYYPGNVIEKSLEHHVALTLLALQPGQVFVDLASEGSPLPEIVPRLFRSEAYAQDIMYAPGVHGRHIGGDAAAMPVADGFAAGACLTCSLEHFEGDADTRLFREMARVLAPGGRLIVVPLYLFSRAAVQTDPLVSAGIDMAFDEDAEIFAARGWGNRHGRFYSATSLVRRLVAPTRGLLDIEIFRLTNPSDVDASVYARWILRATRVA